MKMINLFRCQKILYEARKMEKGFFVEYIFNFLIYKSE